MILVPYVSASTHPLTRHLTGMFAPDAVWRGIDPGNLNGYAQLLHEVWQDDGDLVIIEHDIGVHEKVLPRFLDCDQPWCGNAYPVGHLPTMALGCTRFTAGLKKALPGLMDSLGDWRQLDTRIQERLHAVGHVQHRHFPDVHHFHEYP